MPQSAVMVQLGPAQVFEWQVPHAVDRGVDFQGARSHLFEQDPQLVLIHPLERSRAGLPVNRVAFLQAVLFRHARAELKNILRHLLAAVMRALAGGSLAGRGILDDLHHGVL